MSDLISALDGALAAYGEDITLRRISGTAPATSNADVTCRAKVTAVGTDTLPAGVVARTWDIIISPTQIREAAWPGASVPKVPPDELDQAIPRAMTDKILLRGQWVAITFVDPVFVANEWVRANIKAKG
ncbi:hypothetical protein [Bradyrhizobium sp. SZCCHNRI2049]|uniref:hypothetical protein n=1 Tax=Bradyrhizobium sp. SZCCHNRI2049 TaxID=3057287 RepID=UPI002916B39D|nr:hypothetical protein [Bradyrhizobium sp. SZCCHNRI2049]